LDRFKIQPKYKSTDPDVRLSSIEELGASDEETAVLLALAREDTEPRVRRAAAARIEDVGVLAAMSADDVDPAIREEILARLADMAVGSEPEKASRALGALADQRQISAVAKTSPLENIRADAIARLTDVKSLSSVARHAADPRTATMATERIQDSAELLNVASKTDHKDAGLVALERAVALGAADRGTLDELAERAKNKSVGKRARAMVQAIDEAEAAKRAGHEQQQRRVASAVARVEGLSVATTAAGLDLQLDEAEAEWRDLETNAEIAAADRARSSGAVEVARGTFERARQEQAEREAREAELASARDVKSQLCERVDAFEGEDALDRLEVARSEWEGLAQDPEADVHARFVERFEEACARARTRHENRLEAGKTNARLAELAAEAEQLAGQEDSPAYAWDSVAREWKTLREKTASL